MSFAELVTGGSASASGSADGSEEQEHGAEARRRPGEKTHKKTLSVQSIQEEEEEDENGT